MRVLLLGAGYSAKAYAARLGDRAETIWGTTRARKNIAGMEAAGIAPIVIEEPGLSVALREAAREATHIVASAAPDERGDPFLRELAPVLLDRGTGGWVGYLSTVGVYGDHHGAWVDEESECRPAPGRSAQRLAAEREWAAHGERAGLTVAILRLSGIYGPGRNALLNLAEGRANRVVKPGQVFNRIHVGDIAGALDHLGDRRLGGIFNVSDDLPSPPQDVVSFAASLMGVKPPPEVDYDEARMTPMARSFYGEVKRVANARIKATGFRFEWPDYRTALQRMWAEESWRL